MIKTIRSRAMCSFITRYSQRMGLLKLFQQVSNYAHRKTESQSGYVVGTVPMMRAFFSLSYTIAALLIGCFLALALVHITLWFLFREYKVNLYFSLFCMTWVLRTAVTGPKLVTSIFPDFSWFAAFSIEYITVASRFGHLHTSFSCYVSRYSAALVFDIPYNGLRFVYFLPFFPGFTDHLPLAAILSGSYGGYNCLCSCAGFYENTEG